MANNVPPASITNGWDAVLALSADQVNLLLFANYLSEKPTSLSAPIRAWLQSGSEKWILDVTPGPPCIEFSAGLGPQQLSLSMFLVTGTLLRVDSESGNIASGLLLQPNEVQLSGTAPLTKVTGTDNLGQIALDLGKASYQPCFVWLDQDPVLKSAFSSAVTSFFAGNNTCYPLGTIITSNVSACLQPSDFDFTTQLKPDGSGDGAVVLLIKTNGPGGSVGPLDTYPIPDGYTAALVVSNQVLFNQIVSSALTDMFQKIELQNSQTGQEIPVGGTYAGQLSDGVWKTVGSGGMMNLGVLGSPQGDGYSSDSTGDPSSVKIPLDGLTVEASDNALAASWNHSWEQEFTHVKHFRDKHGNPAEQSMPGNNRIQISYALMSQPSVDQVTDVISFPGSGNVTVHADSPSWWQSVFEFNTQIPAQIKSAIQEVMEGVFGNFTLPDVDTFTLANLLFPKGQNFYLEQASAPCDLVAAGRIRTLLGLSPGRASLQPSQTAQFRPMVVGATLDVSPGTAEIRDRCGSQQFSATVSGFAVDVTWSVLSGSKQAGSIDADGLYTASLFSLGDEVVVATTTSEPHVSAFAHVRLWNGAGKGPVILDPITITPETVSLAPGQSVILTAEAEKVDDIEWTIQPAGAGTITFEKRHPSLATYTAPNSTDSIQAVVVFANHKNDGLSYAMTRILVSTQSTVTAFVNASEVIWEPEMQQANESALYTAPSVIMQPETVTVTAVAKSNAELTASALVTLMPSESTSLFVSPSSISLSAGQAMTLIVTGNDGQPVEATATVNPQVGTIVPGTVAGTLVYTAPQSISSEMTLELTAASAAQPSVAGTAAINLLPMVSIWVRVNTPHVIFTDANGDICELLLDLGNGSTLATLEPGQTVQLIGAPSSLSSLAWLSAPNGIGALDVALDDGSLVTYTAPSTITASQTVTLTAYGYQGAFGIANAGIEIVSSGAARGSWVHSALTTEAGAPSAVGNPNRFVWNQAPQVVYRSKNGHIYLLIQGIDGWSYLDLTVQSGATQSATGDPVGYVWSSDPAAPSIHIIYLANDGYLHELQSPDGTDWMDANLPASLTSTTAATATSAASNPLPGSNPVATAWNSDPDEPSQHVLYRGKDNHIYELVSNMDSVWTLNDLTEAANDSATSATGRPAVFVCDENAQWSSSLHVAFRGAEGNIHEYVSVKSGVWTAAALTDSEHGTGSLAAGDPVGIDWSTEPGGATLHWYYCDVNGHVCEWWYGSDGWSFNDLTSEVNGPAVEPAAVLTVAEWPGDPQYGSSLHVAFTGTDGNIYDLWFHEWAWALDNLTEAVAALPVTRG